MAIIDVRQPAGSSQGQQSGASEVEVVEYNGDAFYDLAANTLLEKIIILGGPANFKMGSTIGGSEIIPPIDIANGEVQVLNIFTLNALRLYFTGIPGTYKIVFIKWTISIL
jgi:hypothetical protein